MKPGPRRSHPGRGGFKPTDEMRAKVEILVAAHQSELNIARVIGCSHETLRKHFREELDTGFAKRNAEVIFAQFETAIKGNASAQSKWLQRSGSQPHLSAYVPPKVAAEEPKAQKLGKKAQAVADAHNPDTSTSMGERIARRMELAKQLH